MESPSEFSTMGLARLAVGEEAALSVNDAVKKVSTAKRLEEEAERKAEAKRSAAKSNVAVAMENEADSQVAAAEMEAKAEKAVASALRKEAEARSAAANQDQEDSPEPASPLSRPDIPLNRLDSPLTPARQSATPKPTPQSRPSEPHLAPVAAMDSMFHNTFAADLMKDDMSAMKQFEAAASWNEAAELARAAGETNAIKSTDAGAEVVRKTDAGAKVKHDMDEISKAAHHSDARPAEKVSSQEDGAAAEHKSIQAVRKTDIGAKADGGSALAGTGPVAHLQDTTFHFERARRWNGSHL